MHSGIGDVDELARVGVDLVQHLPGVGRNFQDHILVPCLWEYKHPLPPHNNGAEATFFRKTDSSVETPDLQAVVMEYPLVATPLAVPLTRGASIRCSFAPAAVAGYALPGLDHPIRLRLTPARSPILPISRP
jgi:choline dehydrogenase-like flavoprotein